MNRNKMEILGLMSGTSLDGLDIAHVSFEFQDDKIEFELLHYQTVSYPNALLDKLHRVTDLSAEELQFFDKELGLCFAEMVLKFLSEQYISKSQIAAIASHGHTVYHQPHLGFTLQIGCGSTMAYQMGIPVINDFRSLDVIAGGQGAPLVPIGDKILFSEYDYCLNLGGFSNISFEWEENRIAFDISPVNTVLNFYANQLGFDYDDKGQISKTGTCNAALLMELNNLDFYHTRFPKSLGFEFVKETILPLIESYLIPTKDKLCTFSEHIAVQIGLALPNKSGTLLITGGGAYNDFVIERIRFHLPEMTIIIPSKKIIEFKEALLFGLLGVLKLRDENIVLSSVTGSLKDHSSGYIYKNSANCD